jgi:hypothetical protein
MAVRRVTHAGIAVPTATADAVAATVSVPSTIAVAIAAAVAATIASAAAGTSRSATATASAASASRSTATSATTTSSPATTAPGSECCLAHGGNGGIEADRCAGNGHANRKTKAPQAGGVQRSGHVELHRSGQRDGIARE